MNGILTAMARESLVFFLGCAVALLPFAGIPTLWRRGVFVVVGFALAVLGYQLRRAAYLRSIVDGNGERKTDAYAEHTPAAQALPDAFGLDTGAMTVRPPARPRARGRAGRAETTHEV